MKKVTALVIFAVMTAALGFGQDGADLDKRIAEYTQAIKNNPNDAEAYRNRGDVYLYDKGDYDRAIADLTQAIRLDPKDAAYYSIRGDAYFNKGDYDKAIADYTQAIRLDPKDAAYYFNRGDAYYYKEDYDKAIADYSEAITRGISDLEAYRFRSFAYFLIKNYDAAIADCTTIIQRNPDIPNTYVVRGDAYGAKGLYHKAVADYRTGFEKGYDPSGFTVDKSSKADMWFCGAMYMEIAVNRFPGNSAVVSKYENWLKTVCDNNKVTRAEVETFYRQNIGALVAAVVDAEFNKISFLIDRTNTAGSSYGAVLTRDTKNQYVLSYEGVFNGAISTKTLTATSLDALRVAMSRNSDFIQDDINQVNAQAVLIPGVVPSKH